MDVTQIISALLVLLVSALAGCDGILDQFQFHQPIISCSLIGLVTGHPVEGIMLGGTLQLIALGWMNIGASVAPDAALAGVASAIFVCYQQSMSAGQAVAVAIPIAIAGLVLSTFIRTLCVAFGHVADRAGEIGKWRVVGRMNFLGLFLQCLRILIPAAILLVMPHEFVTDALDAIPAWVTNGLTTAGGFIVVVGYAMVVNMMATKKTWPFFFLGFALAAVSELGIIAMGIIGVCIALVYLNLSPEFQETVTQAAGEAAIDDILESDASSLQAESSVELSVSDRRSVWMRTWLLMAAFNFERMQNIGWCYALSPVMNKLYPEKPDQIAFMHRHLEFFNTHPYMAAPVFGVVMSLEESRANGVPVEDAAIQGVKIGMMGPLAGVGDPVFWGTLRPVLGAFAASLALTGSVLGPILFFLLWNIIRMAFLWYTQEFGYQAGSSITEDLAGGLLQRVTMGASVLGMFIMGVLIPRWTTIDMSLVVFSTADMGSLDKVYPALQPALDAINGAVNGTQLTPDVLQNSLAAFQNIHDSGYHIVNNPAAANLSDSGIWRLEQATTLQSILDQLLPGLLPLALTFLCMWLLKKRVNPIAIIFGLFAVGILGSFVGIF